MSEPVRLRVVFEDAGVLRGSQRRRGLQRCWLQLRPGIDTIADLAAHLHVTFGLQNSCPHGLVISMDGFVLPSFESTCILKDEDIIMIKKNGVMFQDIVKFCGSQNDEKVLQSRQIPAFNNRILAIMDPQVDSQGDENDKDLFNRSTVHVETPPCEQMIEHCKRKRFNKLQGSNNTLAITDSQEDSQGDEENVGLHGNIEHKETTSYKMVNAKRKKKHANKLQNSDTLANKDFQADSQGDKGDLDLLFPHKETSLSEMIKLNRKRKHFNELQGSDDTLAIKDSQRNSPREEEAHVLHGNTAHKKATSNEMMNANDTLAIMDFHGGSQGDEQNFGLHRNIASLGTTSNEMMNAKHNKNHTNKSCLSEIKKNGVMFQDIVKFCGSQNDDKVLQSRQIPAFNNRILAIMDPQVDSQGDESDKDLFNRSTVDVETPPCEQLIEHCKRKRFNKLQGSNNTLAITDSQEDSQGDEENVGLHGNIEHKETTSYKMVNAKRKKKHANKLQNSDTLANKDSQADSQGDKGDLDLLFPHKETSLSEMIKLNRKRKHFNELQGSDDTLAIKDSQRNSPREEEAHVLHGNTAHKEATSNEMMNANDTLAIKDFHGGSQGDEQNFGLHRNIASLGTTSNEMMNAKHKKNHTNKSCLSENESKENDEGHASKNDPSGDAMKVPSRSARRKKAKRVWLRILKKERKVIVAEFPEGDNQKKAPKYANADQNTDADEEIVRVVVRPGHIHFESSDACSVRSDEPQETLQWNGTTSKKKGQKWGREDTFNKWDDDTSNWLSNVKSSNAKEAKLVEVSNKKSAIEEVEAYKESIVNQVEPVKEFSGNSVAKEFEEVKQLFEFESFKPLIRFPEEGDVLVYRVVELSSSWCPELSPFRVGRVSSYDCSSSKVILLPLPEYPLISEEISEEGQESRSLYNGDGTLEIDFASLVDVRLFKGGESIETIPSTTPIEEMQNATAVNIQESASCSSNRIDISSDHTVNDQLSEGWEVINLALNEKKVQLQKQNDLGKRKSRLKTTTTGPWSYSALRRNALGPTLNMLRSSNDDTGK